MNNYKIAVANITFNVTAVGDFTALRETGLFGEITQINYAQTTEKKDVFVYKVKLNGKHEIAVVERI